MASIQVRHGFHMHNHPLRVCHWPLDGMDSTWNVSKTRRNEWRGWNGRCGCFQGWKEEVSIRTRGSSMLGPRPPSLLPSLPHRDLIHGPPSLPAHALFGPPCICNGLCPTIPTQLCSI
eukprot:scaffold1401_cov330-Pavlova_lutheri.AAC.58